MTNDFFTLMQISGPQAATFLQGQFTCDIRAIPSGKAILGACCDHKGRMLFNGWIGCWQNEYTLLLPENMFATALAHLQKFAVFSKVTLSEKSDWMALNYSGGQWPDLPMSPTIHAQLPLSGFPGAFLHWALGPTDTMTTIQQALAKQASLVEHEQREYLTILANLVYIQPATREQFIPQMISLEKLGGVSFEKGCYVGQEVVARTQHLGQLKRHLHTMQLNAQQAVPPQIGEALFNEQKEVIGQIAAVAKDPQSGYRLLAVIQDRGLSQPIFTGTNQEVNLIPSPREGEGTGAPK